MSEREILVENYSKFVADRVEKLRDQLKQHQPLCRIKSINNRIAKWEAKLEKYIEEVNKVYDK